MIKISVSLQPYENSRNVKSSSLPMGHCCFTCILLAMQLLPSLAVCSLL